MVQLAAIRPLERWVRLAEGRLPRTCTPVRCEVVALGGPRVPDTVLRDRTRFVTVGRGRLISTVPLGFVPSAPVRGQISEARPKALLVAGDPVALEAQPALASVFRSHGWTAPLDTTDVPSWRLDALRGRIERTENALRVEDGGYSVLAPSGALDAARARAREARRRVLLVGAGAAALLAAFTLLVAGALRRDLSAERARLERLGARGHQRAALALAECAWPAVLGCAGGAAVAVAVTALRADAAGLDASQLLRRELLTPAAALGLSLSFALATALVLLGASTWRKGAGRVGDALALGAAGAVALALSRGGVAAGDGSDPLPVLLPPLACLAAGLVTARLATPALRGLEALARSGPLSLRLATLGLARAPRGPAISIAGVAVSVGLACFAAAYGATLDRGARDQAAFAVPFDVTVSQGPQLVPPLVAADTVRWRELTGGGAVLPVQRTSATVPRGAGRVELPLIALPAAALPALRGWREQDASASRPELVRRLVPTSPMAPRGPLIPEGASELTVRTRSVASNVELAAHLVDRDGSGVILQVGTTRRDWQQLRVALPPASAGSHLVAVELQVPSGLRATDGHQQAESASSRAVVVGELVLRDLAIDGRRVALDGWVGRGAAADPATLATTTRAEYRFDDDRGFLRPVQPTDGRPIPVLTDPRTALAATGKGLLPIGVRGRSLQARVVGTVARFATVDPNAAGVIVADEATVRTALSAVVPGAGRPDELWLQVADGAPEERLRRALRREPLRALQAVARREQQARLDADPLARELRRTLSLAALAGLLTAAVGVLLGGTIALRDDRAESYDLEALGVAPATLRSDIRLRAAVIGALGVAAGGLIGAGLLTLVVAAVGVTAAGAVAVPPLVTIVPWGPWLAAAAGLGAIVAFGTAITTHRAFAQDVPARPTEAAR